MLAHTSNSVQQDKSENDRSKLPFLIKFLFQTLGMHLV